MIIIMVQSGWFLEDYAMEMTTIFVLIDDSLVYISEYKNEDADRVADSEGV